jgi:molybdopterin/thiamine biosynthesis adenylyltransferase
MTQSLRISQVHFARLTRHLFPGDRDEHGAVILAGICESPRGTRFITREIVLARDGIDYVSGTRGYRALTTDFIARVSDQCARQKLCYFAVHCHAGADTVGFSPDDLASHARGYPALLDITSGGPVGAIVFANNAAAGHIWRRSGVTTLDEVTVVGPNITHLRPSPPSAAMGVSSIYHRQSMLFGERGQAALLGAKVGIIGLGGVGSLVSQWMAHLGVGHIVGVDFDHLEPTNRPRVIGATPWDAGEPFVNSRIGWVRGIGQKMANQKVHVAARVARKANRAVRFEPIVGDIVDAETALQLRDVDYLILCADGMRPRLVFNALVHQYLIPGVQVGSKVPVDARSGNVGDVFVATRGVLPYFGGGCLSCNKLIPPDRLQEESLTPDERRRQRYVDDVTVTVPSVITLNALAAAQAANDFLFGFQGLLYCHAATGYLQHYPRERKWMPVDVTTNGDCLHCGQSDRSAYGRGDRGSLPCRAKRP